MTKKYIIPLLMDLTVYTKVALQVDPSDLEISLFRIFQGDLGSNEIG